MAVPVAQNGVSFILLNKDGCELKCRTKEQIANAVLTVSSAVQVAEDEIHEPDRVMATGYGGLASLQRNVAKPGPK